MASIFEDSRLIFALQRAKCCDDYHASSRQENTNAMIFYTTREVFFMFFLHSKQSTLSPLVKRHRYVFPRGIHECCPCSSLPLTPHEFSPKRACDVLQDSRFW